MDALIHFRRDDLAFDYGQDFARAECGADTAAFTPDCVDDKFLSCHLAASFSENRSIWLS